MAMAAVSPEVQVKRYGYRGTSTPQGTVGTTGLRARGSGPGPAAGRFHQATGHRRHVVGVVLTHGIQGH